MSTRSENAMADEIKDRQLRTEISRVQRYIGDALDLLADCIVSPEPNVSLKDLEIAETQLTAAILMLNKLAETKQYVAGNS